MHAFIWHFLIRTCFSPQGENTFLYAESKRAKMERERLERKRKMEVEIQFTSEDLALATIPGADFDPKRRHFSPDELRPQPIIRKRKKVYRLFFSAFGPKLRSDKNSGFHQNSDNFFSKTQVFETFLGRSVNKSFRNLSSNR